MIETKVFDIDRDVTVSGSEERVISVGRDSFLTIGTRVAQALSQVSAIFVTILSR